MSVSQPRLRVFAGPNGSGKSTLKEVLPESLLGVYVNADEIEKRIRADGYLSLGEFSIDATTAELSDFLAQSTLLRDQGLLADADRMVLQGGRVVFQALAVNSYHASVLADFIRHKLLSDGTSFTFETVMSSQDKVDFLCKAQKSGFRTYLYFVATEDPDINVSRVQHRVAMGGHPVPQDKIISRYHRSLALLSQAVARTDRAYVFDNSGEDKVWLAEVTDGCELEMKTDEAPHWFKAALWDAFEGDDVD
jgi:predicted ABC-type ATPase